MTIVSYSGSYELKNVAGNSEQRWFEDDKDSFKAITTICHRVISVALHWEHYISNIIMLVGNGNECHGTTKVISRGDRRKETRELENGASISKSVCFSFSFRLLC